MQLRSLFYLFLFSEKSTQKKTIFHRLHSLHKHPTPWARVELATYRLHVFHMFPYGMDYIFTRLRCAAASSDKPYHYYIVDLPTEAYEVSEGGGIPVSSLYGAPPV